MTTTRIHGWTVELLADLDDGGAISGYTQEQIDWMNAYLEMGLQRDLRTVKREEEALEQIANAKRETLELLG